jgi:hypothetical protein
MVGNDIMPMNEGEIEDLVVCFDGHAGRRGCGRIQVKRR